MAELKDVAKEIAELYHEAQAMLRALEVAVQDTHKEWQRLKEVVQLLGNSKSEELSIEDLAFVVERLFASELCGIWCVALGEQGVIEELYNNAAKISDRVGKLYDEVYEFYQNYPEEEEKK